MRKIREGQPPLMNGGGGRGGKVGLDEGIAVSTKKGEDNERSHRSRKNGENPFCVNPRLL